MFSSNPQHAQSFGLDRTLFVHASRFKMLDIEMRSGSVKAPRPESGREPPRMNAGPPSDAARSGKADPNAFVPDPFAFPLTAQGQLNAQQDSWYGVFIKGTPGAPGSYRIKSSGTLFQAKGKAMILEVVEGEDLDPQWSLGGQGKWSAAILWERL